MNPAVIEITEEDPNIKCNFCKSSKIDPVMLGSMYQLEEITVHHFCLLFSSAVLQLGTDDQGIWGFLPENIRKELSRGRRLKCTFCGQNQASIGCCVKRCSCSMHFPCGLKNGSLYQFVGVFESFCINHREGRSNAAVKITRDEETSKKCPVCFMGFDYDEIVLNPPCCSGEKRQHFFHHKCLMTTAANAGLHFFSCPLCLDKEIFPSAMRNSGIYTPDRDATWETGNMFEDQNEMQYICDGKPCLCPQGGAYNNDEDVDGSKWKLIRCVGCSGTAVHKYCGNLTSQEYQCKTCRRVLKVRKSNGKLLGRPRKMVMIKSEISEEETPQNEPIVQHEIITPEEKVTGPAKKRKLEIDILATEAETSSAAKSKRIEDEHKKVGVPCDENSLMVIIDKAVQIFSEKYKRVLAQRNNNLNTEKMKISNSPTSQTTTIEMKIEKSEVSSFNMKELIGCLHAFSVNAK